jgi:hypothetical protein
VQAGAGAKLPTNLLPVLAADDMSAAPVQAGAGAKLPTNLLPVLAADDVSAAPVQAGASTELRTDLLPALVADDVSAAPVQAGAGTKLPTDLLPALVAHVLAQFILQKSQTTDMGLPQEFSKGTASNKRQDTVYKTTPHLNRQLIPSEILTFLIDGSIRFLLLYSCRCILSLSRFCSF